MNSLWAPFPRHFAIGIGLDFLPEFEPLLVPLIRLGIFGWTILSDGNMSVQNLGNRIQD